MNHGNEHRGHEPASDDRERHSHHDHHVHAAPNQPAGRDAHAHAWHAHNHEAAGAPAAVTQPEYRASEMLEPDDAHAAQHGHHGGHDAHAGHGVMHEGHLDMMRNRFFATLPLTILVVLYSPMVQQWLGFTMPRFPGSDWIAPVVGTVIFFYGGMPFLAMARDELAQRQPGMMTLISLAITTAYVYSMGIFFFPPPHAMGAPMDFFWELATLITVMLAGHWIELRSVGQAQGALRELARLLPDTAERLLPDGRSETVAVAQLRAGDRILIRPGASVPADGQVFEGNSAVNESMITGESRPVDKRPGDHVIGGTVNGSGSLRVEVAQVGEETALAGIMRLVADAQASQSRAQTLAQRAAYWLTIIAIMAGAITFAVWLLATGSLADAVSRTVTVLVIACPHALGLAVPLVVAISTTLSARSGLLIRKRTALEAAKDLDYVIFDKTGTLTTGEQGVVALAVHGISEDEALRIAAAVEGDSEHMIARAVREFAAGRGLQPAAVTGFESLPGRGVMAEVGGVRYAVGGPALLDELGVAVPEELRAFAQEAEAASQAVISLADEQAVIAQFAIADVIREESADAVRRLHALGVKVAILTGDSEPVARSVAAALGIDTYFAQVLPEHKASKVRELQRGGARVAMVGDGVNDAPALLTADVGIAVGAGTDVAIESAGIVLARSNPLDIVRIIRLSRATYRKMVENLLWATGYNVIAIPLAMGVLAPFGIVLDPAVGAVFMSLSTVIVAVNAQLLRRLDLREQDDSRHLAHGHS
jgi:P-type Cu2+ transporter